MNRANISRLLYLSLGIACVANGLWLLIDPIHWNTILHMQAEDFGGNTLHPHLMKKLGASYLLAGSALLWCAVNARIHRPVHIALVLFFGLFVAIEVIELLAASVPSHRWITDAPLVFIPFLLLAIMLLPTPRLPQRGERGTVKWFDAKKGFGFIVRENGEEIFVHYRAIRGDGHRALKDGQPVRFRVGQGEKGLQAEEVVPG